MSISGVISSSITKKCFSGLRKINILHKNKIIFYLFLRLIQIKVVSLHPNSERWQSGLLQQRLAVVGRKVPGVRILPFPLRVLHFLQDFFFPYFFLNTFLTLPIKCDTLP